ncbi:MAG: DNA recombination/repair protein RecA, partial [Parcubacteria group bacterium]|nr:DNA recombination/repair protein RecA [Parcubacteria group bacterium]
GEMGDSHMGLQARLMSQALRKLTGSISRSNCTVIFINQLRMKIGVFFGNPETTTGGTALKFYSSLLIEIRRAAQIKQAEKIIGNRVKVKIVKNKVAPPFRSTEFDIMYNVGIDKAADILDTAVTHGILEKRGNSYAYGAEKLGVGRQTAVAYLRDKPALVAELREKVLAKAMAAAETPTPAPVEEPLGDEPPVIEE